MDKRGSKTITDLVREVVTSPWWRYLRQDGAHPVISARQVERNITQRECVVDDEFDNLENISDFCNRYHDVEIVVYLNEERCFNDETSYEIWDATVTGYFDISQYGSLKKKLCSIVSPEGFSSCLTSFRKELVKAIASCMGEDRTFSKPIDIVDADKQPTETLRCLGVEKLNGNIGIALAVKSANDDIDYVNPYRFTTESLIEVFKAVQKKSYTIKVEGSFSRYFDVEADSEEDAYEQAKRQWAEKPLTDDDSYNEEWSRCEDDSY
ncbi:MAG: hypothetical protein J6Y37_18555 [Paludibacteraceae bacterium]|nr:hypothetical protein [Paludibacteraceae bacterium]